MEFATSQFIQSFKEHVRNYGRPPSFRLVEASASPFTHFNVYEDHVTIWDNRIHRLVDVYFRNGRPMCEYCESGDCDHVKFALTLPKVVKALQRKGWIVEDGKVVYTPP